MPCSNIRLVFPFDFKKEVIPEDMKAEISAIGSELLLGQIVDTNSAFIASRLAENGIEVVQTKTIGDDLERIIDTIRESMGRSAIVITTGGIGPTEDDLTRDAIAAVTGRSLAFQPFLMEQIEALFKKRGFRMVESNRKQAFIPEGAVPIENPKGTAPGFIVEGSACTIVTLPGVPSEMKYLLERTVIPYLRNRFRIQSQIIRYKVLRACGLGESGIGSQIQDLMRESKNPAVGTLASTGDIKIRITAKAETPEKADQLIANMEQEIRRRLGDLIYGVDDETLQEKVISLIANKISTISVVETFTIGLISEKLGGAESSSFLQSVIVPSQGAQMRFLNLSVEEYGLRSNDPKELTIDFARKIRSSTDATLGLAVHGKVIEEHGKGEFRVGTYYGLAKSSGDESQENVLGGELPVLRERSSIIALDFLRKHLLK